MRAFPFLLAWFLGGCAVCVPAGEPSSDPQPRETSAADRSAYRSAVIELGNAIGEFGPRSAEAYVARGHLALVKGKLDDAISDFSRAIEVDPKCSLAFLQRARAHMEEGNQSRAKADLEQGIRLAGKEHRIVLRQRLGLPKRTEADLDRYEGKSKLEDLWPGFVRRAGPAAHRSYLLFPEAVEKAAMINALEHQRRWWWP